MKTSEKIPSYQMEESHNSLQNDFKSQHTDKRIYQKKRRYQSCVSLQENFYL